jgi:hypothetical protein
VDSTGESSPAHGDVQHTARSDQAAAQDDITAAPVVHPYGTRLKHNLRQPKKRTDGTVAWSAIKVPSEPTDYTVAMKDPLWLQAMNEEFQALKKNGTCHLILPRPDLNIIDCKWVFRLKHCPDGSIDRYKARLVAKDFKQ